ncbi:MAG: hypothetical protein COB23_06655 [Methylophaga sp.]|nr:MAG: hypothetical protein COB23_06655 [Methylophaga sp.]
MTKLIVTVLSTFILSSAVWAQPYAHINGTNSLSQAVLKIASMRSQPQVDVKVEPSSPYTHESEQYNSLSRAVLAIQGAKVNIRLNAATEVTYARHSDAVVSQRYNSLSRGALAK